jgi:hypothetical protein
VAPRRLQLEGASLEELTDRVFAEHGSAARIVSAEKVTTGGIRGFFAKQHFEVIVELPDPGRRAAHRQLDMSARLGIAALLDDADAAEAQLHGDAPEAAVSTGSPDFARLMDDLTFTVAPEAAAPEPAVPTPTPALPAPLAKPSQRTGDLVLIVGADQDAFVVARSMAAMASSPAVYVGGSLIGATRVDDRRTSLAARAVGVAGGHSVFAAFGLGPGARDAADRAAAIAGIGADQVWLAVDAGRKPDDTARWVKMVAAVVPIHAVAVQGADATSSPDTVNTLGLPIGWRDGRPVG